MATLSLLHFDEPAGVGFISNVSGQYPHDLGSSPLGWYSSGANSLRISSGGVFGNCLSGSSILRTPEFGLPGDLTLEFRFKWSTPQLSGGRYLGFRNALGLYSGILLSPVTGPDYRILAYTNDGTENTLNYTDVQYDPNEWGAYAIVISNGLMSVYFNGQRILQDQTTNTDGQWTIDLEIQSDTDNFLDEVRFSDEALYTGETYEIASAPFEPLFVPTTKISQVAAQAVTADQEPTPDFYTKLSQVKAQAVTSETEEVEWYTYLSQLQVVSATAEPLDLPTFTTYLSQLQAVSVTTDSVPLPVFATYLTQLRTQSLIGKLMPMPEPRTFLTQFKAQSVDVQPLSLEPLTFSFEKQVLNQTEPAEYTQVFSVRNLALRQEFIVSQVFIYSVSQQVAMQEEGPKDPPLKNHQALTYLSVADQYPVPGALRSNSWLLSAAQLTSVQDTMDDPSTLRGPTASLSQQSTYSTPETFRDPETLQASSTSRSTGSQVSSAEQYPDPEDVRGPTTALSLHVQDSVVHPFPNPEDVRSQTQQLQLATDLSGQDTSYPNPDDLRSAAVNLSSGTHHSVVDTEFDDPQDLSSTTKSLTTKQSVSVQELMSDPSDIQSVTKATTLKQSVSIVEQFTDPSIMVQTLLNMQNGSQYSTPSPMTDPELLRSPSRQLSMFVLHSTDDQYPDPSTLYQYPMRSHSAFMQFSIAEKYDNPFGYAQPIVNVHYFWAS